MKYIKFIWGVIDALAWGITQSGRVEILPTDDDCNSHDKEVNNEERED